MKAIAESRHDHHPQSQRASGAAWSSWLVAVSFLFLFLALRTRAYLAVDGALRCLNVFFAGERYHGNNHMLYPFWIGMWAKVNALLGLRASDAFQFIAMSQAMNAFLAAGCIACLYHLIRAIAGLKGALLGTLLFSFSTALTLHATNSAEVLPGLFFALLALVILAVGMERSNSLVLALAGGVLAVALASYEAMGTAAGAAVLVCCFWPRSAIGQKRFSLPWRLIYVGAGGLAGVILVYGAAYADQGIPFRKMPHQFFSLGGAPEVYGGFRPSNFVNLP